MSHPHQSQRSHRNRGQQTANSVSTTEETISLPSIITARVMPSKRQEFGWVGSVKTIGPHHGRLVLFPNEGVNMNILPSGVVFLCENDLTSHPIKGRDGYVLTGTPIGNRSFGSDEDIKKAQEIKKIEINDYLVKKALHAQAIEVMQGIELPFVRKGKRHLEELCQLAIQGSNIEALQSLMMLVTEVKNLTIPTGVVIGGSYSGVGGRHECVVMNASNELIVMAVAVAVSKGWWAFAAMQDPDKTQWAVAMTTTEQAAFDWDPQDELVRLKEGKKPAAPISKPRPAPAVTQSVIKKPAVARPKETVISGGLGALSLPVAPAVEAPDFTDPLLEKEVAGEGEDVSPPEPVIETVVEATAPTVVEPAPVSEPVVETSVSAIVEAAPVTSEVPVTTIAGVPAMPPIETKETVVTAIEVTRQHKVGDLNEMEASVKAMDSSLRSALVISFKTFFDMGLITLGKDEAEALEKVPEPAKVEKGFMQAAAGMINSMPDADRDAMVMALFMTSES